MSKILYTAIKLSEASRQELLSWWVTNCENVMSTVIADHMTIKFKPTKEEVAETPLGETASMVVTGFGSNGVVQAVRVTSTIKSANDIPHVTVGIERTKGGRPKDSNSMLKECVVDVKDGPMLIGTVIGVTSDFEHVTSQPE